VPYTGRCKALTNGKFKLIMQQDKGCKVLFVYSKASLLTDRAAVGVAIHSGVGD